MQFSPRFFFEASSASFVPQLIVLAQSKCSIQMDPDVHKLLMLLMLQLSLLSTLECLSRERFSIFVWHLHQMWSITLALHGFKGLNWRRPRRLWAHERGLHQAGFFNQNLLGSFKAREFKERMRMDMSTLEYLCSTLAPDLHIRDTNMRLAIPVQVKVVVSISRLAT